MNEVKDELIRNDNEMKRPSKVNTRDIRPRVAQVTKEERTYERDEISIF